MQAWFATSFINLIQFSNYFPISAGSNKPPALSSKLDKLKQLQKNEKGMSMTCPSFTFIAFCVLSVQMSVLKMDKDLINLLTYKGLVGRILAWKKNKKSLSMICQFSNH